MAEHSTTDPGDDENETHGVGDHGAGHDHDDHGDGHEVDALGPIDVERWGAFVLGIGLALIVVLCIIVATGGTSA